MNKIYSTAYLTGGLGNQMFQIAHAVAQAWKNNVESIFYLDSNVGYENWNTKVYSESIFKKINFSKEILKTERISEYSFNESNLSFKFNKSIEFFGYFQSSKNFLGYDEKIKELFSPTNDFIEKMKHSYPQLMNDNTISVHIRRGDYLKITGILPVVDISYINKAVELHGNYDAMFIFSDDKEWARNNLSFKNSIVVDGILTEEELWLMSMCKNNIISNSTFSWWASFLNKNIYKKVYAPSIWFGPDGPKYYNNLYEYYWKIVDVEYKNGRLIKK